MDYKKLYEESQEEIGKMKNRIAELKKSRDKGTKFIEELGQENEELSSQITKLKLKIKEQKEMIEDLQMDTEIKERTYTQDDLFEIISNCGFDGDVFDEEDDEFDFEDFIYEVKNKMEDDVCTEEDKEKLENYDDMLKDYGLLEDKNQELKEENEKLKEDNAKLKPKAEDDESDDDESDDDESDDDESDDDESKCSKCDKSCVLSVGFDGVYFCPTCAIQHKNELLKKEEEDKDDDDDEEEDEEKKDENKHTYERMIEELKKRNIHHLTPKRIKNIKNNLDKSDRFWIDETDKSYIIRYYYKDNHFVSNLFSK